MAPTSFLYSSQLDAGARQLVRKELHQWGSEGVGAIEGGGVECEEQGGSTTVVLYRRGRDVKA
eukprot:770179-Prorocentrum_lima.AAC.1